MKGCNVCSQLLSSNNISRAFLPALNKAVRVRIRSSSPRLPISTSYHTYTHIFILFIIDFALLLPQINEVGELSAGLNASINDSKAIPYNSQVCLVESCEFPRYVSFQ